MPRIIKVKSFTEPSIEYSVKQYANGEWGCDCLAFLYRGYKKGICDHIRRARHQRMKRHGIIYNRSVKYRKAVKRYNHLCRRYRAKENKLMNTNIGRVNTITKLYSELEELRIKILKLKGMYEI